RQLREWHLMILAAHHAAIAVQRDGIHPSGYHAVIAELVYSFPSLRPCGLSRFPSAVIPRSSRKQQPDGAIKTPPVCLAICFHCHCCKTPRLLECTLESIALF